MGIGNPGRRGILEGEGWGSEGLAGREGLIGPARSGLLGPGAGRGCRRAGGGEPWEERIGLVQGKTGVAATTGERQEAEVGVVWGGVGILALMFGAGRQILHCQPGV